MIPDVELQEKSRKSSTQLAKDAAMDLERRCPKVFVFFLSFLW